MTTVLFTTTTEGAARLVRKDKVVTENGFVLIRAWPYLDNQTADTLSTTLDAVATYSGPKADNQTYAGTFVNSKVELIEGNPDSDDRADTIQQSLILVSDIPVDAGGQESADALAALTPQITQENEILQPFALTTGEEDTLAYIYSNIDPTDRNNCIAIPDADLVSQVANADTTGITWTYVDRKFEQLKDNTGRFTLLFKQVVWNDWSEASPTMTEKQNEGTEHEQLVETWFRVKKTDLATIQSEVYTDDTDYNVMRVNIRENQDGSLRVQRTQWHEAFGASGSEIEADTTDTLDKFSLVTGTMNRVIIVNEALKAKATAYLTLSGAKTGYTLIKTEEQFRKSDGLWDVYRTYEKVTWVAWSTNPAANKTEYFDTGTDSGATSGSEQNGIRKTWVGIAKADLSAAMTELRDGTGHVAFTTGYIIDGATVSDNKNGSITLTQTQHKRIDDVDVDQVTETNPNGFANHNGTLTFLRTVYKDFSKTALNTARAAETPPGGTFVVQDVSESIQGNGYWSLTFTYMSPSWPNTSGTTPNIVPLTRRIYRYDNYSVQNTPAWVTSTGYVLDDHVLQTNIIYVCVTAHTSGTFATDLAAGKWEGFAGVARKLDGADGIPIASVEEIRDNETIDTNHAVDDIQLTEAQNGEGKLRKVQTRLLGATEQHKRQFIPANGRQEETEILFWRNITHATCKTIADNAESNSGAMASATPAAPASHKLKTYVKSPAQNGTFNLTRITFIPRGATTLRFVAGTQDPFKIFCSSFTNRYGVTVQKIVTFSRLITTNEAAARTHAKASSLHPVDLWRMGWVKWVDGYSSYEAMKVTVQDWVAGGTFNFDDAG